MTTFEAVVLRDTEDHGHGSQQAQRGWNALEAKLELQKKVLRNTTPI